MLKNKKGFTLVELLAVIVIMGILMLVAIPAISRVIENSRKDTFVDIAKSYANAAKTLWTADTLTCDGISSSAVDDGDYYILINSTDTAKTSLPVLVDQGGKSSWGNRDVNGFVRVHIETIIDDNGTPKRTTTFYVGLSDGTHGVIDNGTMASEDIKRGNIKMNLSSEELKNIELTTEAGWLDCSKTNLGTYACQNVVPPKYISGLCNDENSSSYISTINVNPTNFAADDWTTIAAAAKSGAYVGKYNVGDTKEIDLGDLGVHTVRIANTSTPSECQNSNFSQTACGFVLEFVDIISTHNMNSTATNAGGWAKTEMRNYINSTVYNSIPAALRSSIIDTKVISSQGANEQNSYKTTDKLYLLDTKELVGKSFNHSCNTVKDSERQLDYYKSKGASTTNYQTLLVKTHNGTAKWWWLRSGHTYYNNAFWNVNPDGYWDTAGGATDVGGVSPAFRIA